MTHRSPSTVPTDRRHFLSFCLKWTKMLIMSLSIGTFCFPKSVILGDERPRPPTGLRIGRGMIVPEDEINKEVTALTQKYGKIFKEHHGFVSPEQIKRQREVTVDAVKKILKSKGYQIKPPTGLRIIQ